jgi:hypothetical protein
MWICLPNSFNKLLSNFNKSSTTARESIRVSATRGIEMLTAPIINERVKFTGLLINRDYFMHI